MVYKDNTRQSYPQNYWYIIFLSKNSLIDKPLEKKDDFTQTKQNKTSTQTVYFNKLLMCLDRINEASPLKRTWRISLIIRQRSSSEDKFIKFLTIKLHSFVNVYYTQRIQDKKAIHGCFLNRCHKVKKKQRLNSKG